VPVITVNSRNISLHIPLNMSNYVHFTIVLSYFSYNTHETTRPDIIHPKTDYSTRMSHGTDTNTEEVLEDTNILLQTRSSNIHRMMSGTPAFYEDLLGTEVIIPRDTDRILEQFGAMMLRISAYISKEKTDFNGVPILTHSDFSDIRQGNNECTAVPPDTTDTPPFVGNSNARTASYLRDYPQIFMKKPEIPLSLGHDSTTGFRVPQNNNKVDNDFITHRKWSYSLSSTGSITVNVDTPTSPKRNKVNSESKDKKPLTNNTIDKIVTFTQNKNVTSTTDEENTEKIDTDIKKSEQNNLSCISKDSLQSLIDEINNSRSLNAQSLKKDETKFRTAVASSSQNIDSLQLKISSTSKENSETSSTADKATSTHSVQKELRRDK
jgi:hypothetical protein